MLSETLTELGNLSADSNANLYNELAGATVQVTFAIEAIYEAEKRIKVQKQLDEIRREVEDRKGE